MLDQFRCFYFKCVVDCSFWHWAGGVLVWAFLLKFRVDVSKLGLVRDDIFDIRVWTGMVNCRRLQEQAFRQQLVFLIFVGHLGCGPYKPRAKQLPSRTSLRFEEFCSAQNMVVFSIE